MTYIVNVGDGTLFLLLPRYHNVVPVWGILGRVAYSSVYQYAIAIRLRCAMSIGRLRRHRRVATEFGGVLRVRFGLSEQISRLGRNKPCDFAETLKHAIFRAWSLRWGLLEDLQATLRSDVAYVSKLVDDLVSIQALAKAWK